MHENLNLLNTFMLLKIWIQIRSMSALVWKTIHPMGLYFDHWCQVGVYFDFLLDIKTLYKIKFQTHNTKKENNIFEPGETCINYVCVCKLRLWILQGLTSIKIVTLIINHTCSRERLQSRGKWLRAQEGIAELTYMNCNFQRLKDDAGWLGWVWTRDTSPVDHSCEPMCEPKTYYCSFQIL